VLIVCPISSCLWKPNAFIYKIVTDSSQVKLTFPETRGTASRWSPVVPTNVLVFYYVFLYTKCLRGTEILRRSRNNFSPPSSLFRDSTQDFGGEVPVAGDCWLFDPNIRSVPTSA